MYDTFWMVYYSNLLRAEMVAELRGNDEEEMKNGIGKDVGMYNPGKKVFNQDVGKI